VTAQEPRGPTLHASEFCNVFRKWAQLSMAPQASDSEHETRWRKDFRRSWEFIELAINKSCLLDRLIYCQDKEVSTTPCPIHKGHWGGITLPACTHCGGSCGCNTGWMQPILDQLAIADEAQAEGVK